MTTSKKACQINVRWMILRDMDEILVTEHLSSKHHWSEDDFLHHLRKRNCIGQVAEIGDSVIGHCLYELERDRLEIVNLAVHPAFRRRGVASKFIEKLIGKLSTYRYQRLAINVADDALPAHLFLRHHGFKCTRIKRWDDGDIYRMVYEPKWTTITKQT